MLAFRSYSTEVSVYKLSNGEDAYVAENPELDGCMAQGSSFDEAVDRLKTVRVDFIYYLLVDGLEVPEPGEMYKGYYVTMGSSNEVIFIKNVEGSGALRERKDKEADVAQDGDKKVMSFSAVTAYPD